MTRQVDAAQIEKAIRALTTAQKTNLGIEVTLPVAFGDGELVYIVVESAGDKFIIHDAGFSAMRLTSAGVSLSKHVVFRLNEFSRRYRCVFTDGRVSANCGLDEISQVACLVANASRAVADYVYELRRQADYDFRVILFDKLRQIAGNRIREMEEFRGESGTHYRLPIILDPAQSRPQNFLATLPHRNLVPRSFAMFYDLRPKYPKVDRDVVYDETADIREEDRTLLSSVSTEVIGLMEADLRFRKIVGHA